MQAPRAAVLRTRAALRVALSHYIANGLSVALGLLVISACVHVWLGAFAASAAVLSWWPSLFDSAKTVAGLYGGDPATGFLFIAAPLMVAAGLPAWWVLGACVRWFDKRRGKDIGELAADAAAVVKDVRGVL